MARDDGRREAEVTHQVRLPGTSTSIDAVTEAEAVVAVVESLRSGAGGLVVTPNVDHLHQLARGGALTTAYQQADLVLADGMPLVWASRISGDPLPERVAGSHLLLSLSEAAAENGLSVFLLGGTPGAAEEAARRFVDRWPSLKVAGTACPPVGFERDRAAVVALCDEVAAADPDIVFVALGAPKQELLALELRAAHPSAWYLGVGAAVDMAAGIVRRAPTWAQKLGIEWIFRLVQEPGRMARRYLVDDLPFAVRLVVAAALARVRRGAGR